MTQPKPTLRRKIQGVMFKLPGMITCDQFEDFILEYLEGELPRGKRLMFDAHLKMCKECREYLRLYKKSLSLLPALKTEEKSEIENIPEDLVTAIMDTLKAKDT